MLLILPYLPQMPYLDVETQARLANTHEFPRRSHTYDHKTFNVGWPSPKLIGTGQLTNGPTSWPLSWESGLTKCESGVWRHDFCLGWSHEFARNGPTGLPPGSSPLHQANGGSPVDMRSTLPPANGRQRTHPYSSFQQSMARMKRNTQDGVAGTFARPQSDQKHLEVDEKPNIKALPTSDG
ncbi:hypothetical protein O181_129725 [Austropuccinia psidii MF-1]|uniref:Uncharacterized protein n=1 Tax=Austropuccinia psidii MF-1 TaxID=1389203 RepID=A0A9Q3KXN6_9BASI|nr:hypothetical protein [Austropuccinia psidii MF-1]